MFTPQRLRVGTICRDSGPIHLQQFAGTGEVVVDKWIPFHTRTVQQQVSHLTPAQKKQLLELLTKGE